MAADCQHETCNAQLLTCLCLVCASCCTVCPCTSCLGAGLFPRDSSHSCLGLACTTRHPPSCHLPAACRFATLRKLLCSDSLWGGCEYDVFCAVLKWVGVESAREGHLAELLGLIRFPTMTLDQLTAVGKEPRVVACPGFKVGTHVVAKSRSRCLVLA